MLANTPNQLSKFRTKNWFEIYDDVRGTHKTNSQNKFKTTMTNSIRCDYKDSYILGKETISVADAVAVAAAADNANKKMPFENCALFADSISEINETQF